MWGALFLLAFNSNQKIKIGPINVNVLSTSKFHLLEC